MTPKPTPPATAPIQPGTITIAGMKSHCYLSDKHGWTMTAENIAKLLDMTPKALYDLRRARKDDLLMGVHLDKMTMTELGNPKVVWTRTGVEILASLLETTRGRDVEEDIETAEVKGGASWKASARAISSQAREEAMAESAPDPRRWSAGEVPIVLFGARHKAYVDSTHGWLMPCATVTSMLRLTAHEMKVEKGQHVGHFAKGTHLVRHGKRGRFYWTRAGVIRLCLLSRKHALKYAMRVLLTQ